VVPADALASNPDELGAADAARLLCAAVTTFNALRHCGAMPGAVVAILGIGGLGHLGVQFANKLGFRTVAIARGADKEALSRKLGAHHFIGNATEDVAAALNRLGGARVVLATVASAKAMTPVIDGLAERGRLIVIGIDGEPIEISPLQLIGASRSIVGHASGAAIDSQDTLAFSALSGVRPMIETMPLPRAAEAYADDARRRSLPDSADDRVASMHKRCRRQQAGADICDCTDSLPRGDRERRARDARRIVYLNRCWTAQSAFDRPSPQNHKGGFYAQ
jgi:D-arabinose 1-dehydrogenase-like Zn-dependent alcohol dehydrogenase